MLWEDRHWRLTRCRLVAALFDTAAEVDFLKALLLKRGVRVWASVRVAAGVTSLLLLLFDGGLVEALVDGAIKLRAATCVCQVLLLLHDLSAPLRYERLLLNLASRAPVLKSLVHLVLPAAIVVREGHI